MSVDAAELVREFETAWDTPRTLDAVQGVKRALTRAIESVAPSVRVTWTEYFNHSFVPDLILNWQESDAEERGVFLRFTSDQRELAEDITAVGSRHPILYGISAAGVGHAREPDSAGAASNVDLKRAAQGAGVLVTDSYGFAPLSADGRQTGGLLGAAVLRGGQSLLDGAASARLVGDVEGGFDAAIDLDVERTASAIGSLTEFLAPAQARRLTGFLQALWVGNGGDAFDFPGDLKRLGSELSDEALTFLLTWDVDIEDPSFWTRIGNRTTLTQLLRLGAIGATFNLQSFVRSSLERLQTRVMSVRGDQEGLIDTRGLTWRLVQGHLRLTGADFSADFGDLADSVRRSGQSDGLTIDELRQRANDAIRIIELQLAVGNEEVRWSSSDFSDVTSSENLRTALPHLAGVARVKHAVVAASRPLDCDLTRGYATTGSRGTVSLADMLRSALPVLWRLQPSDRLEVGETVRQAEQLRDQPDLFSALDEGPDL